ncbi:RrF2 family transcriptional regulator [Megalodesulfovibrio gigas]|uniref:Putative RRF2 protein n=2 Tax=Megalodesulfovibrio gigas TaxID=879 RepID=T2GF98_MEGG1|nr:Rrf2 family transcriptional regulator [Megalodesulfovibrio gigas]AAL86367.1 putative RRF2 protein [Megalodesulfovibrio gigas]AGW14806.1 putative RRF2 protein [Megalodesulfovibrio gigas DSM 1382 = ATCC 19364]
MKLSTRSRYGTRMVLDIAMHSQAGPVRISDISKRQGVSVKYLEKLIRPLKQAGFIKSKRGPRGGHVLSDLPERIAVGAVVRAMEGEMALTECAKDASVCPISGDCLTRKVWIEATRAMLDRLDAITFLDLMREAERAGGGVDRCLLPRES